MRHFINRFLPKSTHHNPSTTYNNSKIKPKIHPKAFIHHFACIIGDVEIGENALIAPFASIRADEGSPFFIGKNSNVQDGAVIHGLKGKYVEVDGRKYSVYIAENTSLAHQSMVHGPSKIGSNVFIGVQGLIFNANVGDNVVIEHGARVIDVDIPSNSYVPAGMTVKTQEQVRKLPKITSEYPLRNINSNIISVNQELTTGYSELFR